MTDFRKQVAASYVQADETQITGFDLSQFLQHLLLFDAIVLKSGRLADLGHLVRLVGFDTAIELIQARGVKISCHAGAIVRAGEPRIIARSSGALALSGLDYGVVTYGRSFSEWIDSGFAHAHAIAGLTRGKASKFENVVRSKLLPEEPTAHDLAFKEARRDLLMVSASVHEAIRLSMRRRLGAELPQSDAYTLEISFKEGVGYTAETDLVSVLSRPVADVAAALNEGLLGALGIHSVLEEMRRHNALVGIQQDEMSVFDAKLNQAADQHSFDSQGRRLSRVVDVLHLPDLSSDVDSVRVNVKILLSVRESDECRHFRDWLFGADEVSDAEIQEKFAGVRTRLGSFVRSGTGRVVRWAVGNGVGFLPIVGQVLGVAVSAVDTFLVEQVLPGRGALTFLGDKYPSIFKT